MLAVATQERAPSQVRSGLQQRVLPSMVLCLAARERC